MAKRATKFPGISRNKGESIWFARQVIPADCRAILGRNQFVASTGETEPAKAYAKAAPMLAEWKARIAAARAASSDPITAEVERLAIAYRKARQISDAPQSILVADVLQFAFETLGGFSAAERRAALLATSGHLAQAVQSLPRGAQIGAAIEVITGQATPFLAHLTAWQAQQKPGQTTTEYTANIKAFAAFTGQPLEALTRKHIKAWIESRFAAGKSVKTVQRNLSAVKSYWSYMVDHEHVTDTTSQLFDGHKFNGHKTEAETEEDGRDRFEPSDVVKLWQQAEADGCTELANLIRIAAYTGARRGSIASLKVSQIRTGTNATMPHIHFADKTKAGVRDIPIHSEIGKLIAQLVANAKDGYLFSDKKGVLLGHKFSALKTRLGFDDRYCFHSIRHTVAHLFEIKHCPEGIAQDILGHKKKSLTFGTYSGVTPLATKAEWLEKSICYPV